MENTCYIHCAVLSPSSSDRSRHSGTIFTAFTRCAPPPKHAAPHTILAQAFPAALYCHLRRRCAGRRSARAGKQSRTQAARNATGLGSEPTNPLLGPGMREFTYLATNLRETFTLAGYFVGSGSSQKYRQSQKQVSRTVKTAPGTGGGRGIAQSGGRVFLVANKGSLIDAS